MDQSEEQQQQKIVVEVPEKYHIIGFDVICRLCANQNDKIIGIYSEEGALNDLANKMNLYLPVKVSENDTLPLQCCWSCASTVLAWHELVLASVEADRRFRELQVVPDIKSVEVKPDYAMDDDISAEPEPEQDADEPGYTEAVISKDDINEETSFCDERLNSKIDSFGCSKTATKSNKQTCLQESKHLKRTHNVQQKRFRRRRKDISPEYYCDVCKKGFTRKYDMQKHRNHKHPNKPKIEDATNTVHKNTDLLERCKISSTDNKICYKCEICNKTIKQTYNFLRHQTIHTGVRAFFCHICGKNFRISGGLHRHITEHHYGVKKYPCNVCNKTFAAKATRDDHENIHTNNRPFVCDICGKAFKQKASLHIHKLFHTDNYRFGCEICGKKYRRASELKVHNYLHTGHKPHKCEMCGSMFRLKQDLKRHQKVHNKSASLQSANQPLIGKNV